MKKQIIFLLVIINMATVVAGVPQKFSYQAVVRNNSNALITNSNIGIQISILQGSISGTPVYVERIFPTTNANGLMTIEIGTGTQVYGSFSSINWANGSYYLKTEIDLNGGSNYSISGTTELLSVPFALYAKKAEEVDGLIYTKSVKIGSDGKLTITPSMGTDIVYDAKTYVTYDIALANNILTVNGVNKGSVAIPALTFGADNKLISGTTVVADLSSWVRTLTLSADNYLVINGTKSNILIPAATLQSVDVKGITIAGNVLTITKNDGSTSTITLPQTALTLTAVSDTYGGLTLRLNGVDTKVTIKNNYAVVGGFLNVNGVTTTVAIPTENRTSVIFTKDGSGNIISATISDGRDAYVLSNKVTVTDLSITGKIITVTYSNGTTKTLNLP